VTDELKVYVGVVIPEEDGRRDTSNETAVLVVVTDEDDNGVRQMVATRPLKHICAGSDQRSKMFRREYGCHSPTGFSWGYAGSGPADLALCILVDMGLPDRDAWRIHQLFKANVIGNLGQGKAWQLDQLQIEEWLLNTARYKRPVRVGSMNDAPMFNQDSDDEDLTGQEEVDGPLGDTIEVGYSEGWAELINEHPKWTWLNRGPALEAPTDE
jgi:hypothetical protein